MGNDFFNSVGFSVRFQGSGADLGLRGIWTGSGPDLGRIRTGIWAWAGSGQDLDLIWAGSGLGPGLGNSLVP